MADLNTKIVVLFLQKYSATAIATCACFGHLETLLYNTWMTRGAMVFTCCAQTFRKCNRVIRGVHSVSICNYSVCDLWMIPITVTA